MKELAILICAPVGRDAELLQTFLREGGVVSGDVGRDIAALSAAERDRAGALLIAEEALTPQLIERLSALLEAQPVWSDLPVLLLAPGGRDTASTRAREHERLSLGHLTVLERPLRPSSLLSAVQTVLQARRRQFQLRDAIAQRDNAFEALRASEQRSRMILESTHDCIKLLDLEGRLLSMNDEGQKRLRIPAFADVFGASWVEMWAKAEQPAAREAIRRAAEGTAGSFEAFYEVGGEEPTWWDTSVTPVRDASGRITNLLAVSREVTGRKQAEQALLQSEKLAAVGRLASSISHEINNPLEAVTNLLYLALQSRDLPGEVQDLLLTADAELARASQIVGQTLRFHRQSTKPKLTTPDELLSSVIILYRGRLMNSDIAVEVDHRPGAQVRCMDGEIRQVLSNLVGNAIDAMRTGGRLVVRSHAATDWTTGRKGVIMTVADTGTGMDPAVQRRVFEAFYSTKGDNGTGLGLWITKGIVDKHEGRLQVRSRLGHGTVFRLFLPFDGLF